LRVFTGLIFYKFEEFTDILDFTIYLVPGIDYLLKAFYFIEDFARSFLVAPEILFLR
jgi:hypothetical protein